MLASKSNYGGVAALGTEKGKMLRTENSLRPGSEPNNSIEARRQIVFRAIVGPMNPGESSPAEIGELFYPKGFAIRNFEGSNPRRCRRDRYYEAIACKGRRILGGGQSRLANKSPLEHKRGRPAEAREFPIMRGQNLRRRSSQRKLRRFFLNDWAEPMPGRGNVSRNKNHTWRKPGNDWSKPSPDVKRLLCQCRDGRLVAFFRLVEQLVKSDLFAFGWISL